MWRRGTFHGVSPKHLQRDLDEFSYRFDHRCREGELFGFVLRCVGGGHLFPYRCLLAEGTAYAEELQGVFRGPATSRYVQPPGDLGLERA